MKLFAELSGNRLVQRRELQRRQRHHIARVKQAEFSPCVFPGKFAHLSKRGNLAEREHAQRIRERNSELVRRIQAIMCSSGAAEAMEFAPGVRISKTQVPVIDNRLSERVRRHLGVRGCKTMRTFMQRAQRHKRLEEENLQLARTLRNTRPTVSAKEIEQDYRQHCKYKANLTTNAFTIDHTVAFAENTPKREPMSSQVQSKQQLQLEWSVPRPRGPRQSQFRAPPEALRARRTVTLRKAQSPSSGAILDEGNFQLLEVKLQRLCAGQTGTHPDAMNSTTEPLVEPLVEPLLSLALSLATAHRRDDGKQLH